MLVHCTVCNGTEELFRTFCWHSGSCRWDYSLDGWMYDQLTNQGSLQSQVKLSSWTGGICCFIDLVENSIECEDYRQAFDHGNHTTHYT